MTKKIDLSNALAVLGALAVVCGLGMLRIAVGVIALGVFLIVGAVATAGVQMGEKTTKAAKTQ